VKEKLRYTKHQNTAADVGYRQHLLRLLAPLVSRVPASAAGLDFGCGPSPVLAEMLAERGYSIEYYDPFFFPQRELLLPQYDFITCCEAVEHFHNPLQEWTLLASLLKPGGLLGISTETVPENQLLRSWSYLRDFTHVSLYSEASLNWIASRFSWSVDKPQKGVFLFS